MVPPTAQKPQQPSEADAGQATEPVSTLEQGFLLRWRSWRDALPWLAMGDCLRPATSVIHWFLVGLALTAAGWLTTDSLFDPQQDARSGEPLVLAFAWADNWLLGGVTAVAGPWIALLGNGTSTTDIGWLLLRQLGLIAIWVFPAAMLMRQSGLAMAGRLPMGSWELMRLVAARLPAFLGAFLIPLIVLAGVWFYFWLTAMAVKIPAVGFYLSGALQVLGIPFALAASLIGFGSLAAIPLAWAAISLERDGNAFDGISRGYEYVLRRPLQLVGYGLLGLVAVLILSRLAAGVGQVGWMLVESATTSGLGASDADPATGNSIPRWTQAVLLLLPKIAVVTVGWSLVSWLYLLLRRSANSQEIEDLWEAPRPAAEPLPEFNLESTGEQPQAPRN